MKSISTLCLVLMALLALPFKASAEDVTFDFSDPNFRENIGEKMSDVKGFIYNEIFTVDATTLQVTAGSAPSRIYVDPNRGQNLVTYKEYTTLTFKAPENYAITKIEFTAAGNSNINNLTPSSGAVNGMVWTGNADGVRFAQGGTSYLANAIVSLTVKDASTTSLPAIEYTECANIAAFNALEVGTYAKVTLTDAEITGKSHDGYSTVWIQDATGGCWIQYTSLNDKLTEKTKVSGTVYVVKRLASGNPQMKEAEDTPNSELSETKITDYTIIEGTIADINVAANLNKMVKVSGETFTASNTTSASLNQGNSKLTVNNGKEEANQQLHKLGDFTKDKEYKNVTIVGILVATSATDASKNQLLPISFEGTTEAATIAEFNTILDGTTTKLTLDNARVNGNLYGTYYVEDATGATAIKNVNLSVGTKLNGYITGVKGTEDVDYVNTPSQGYEYSMTAEPTLSSYETSSAELVGTSMTITEASQQATYGKLVTLSDVEITQLGNGNNKQLKDADGKTMKARDLFGVLSDTYTWPEKVSKITGVVLYYMNGWYLLPISKDAIVASSSDGIKKVNTDINAENMVIYNLQGVRMNQLQKGINIVNGRKVVVR